MGEMRMLMGEGRKGAGEGERERKLCMNWSTID